MEKQWGLSKWGMCTHLDTHLQMVALFMELFVFLRQTITSSNFSVMLINLYSTAKNMTLALSIYLSLTHKHTLTHTSVLAHTLFCYVVSCVSLSFVFFPLHCHLPPFSCSLFLQSWAKHTLNIPTSTSSLALHFCLCLHFLSSPSFSNPLSVCISVSYGVHLSAVPWPRCDLSLLLLPRAGWLAGRATGSWLLFLHLLEKFART